MGRKKKEEIQDDILEQELQDVEQLNDIEELIKVNSNFKRLEIEKEKAKQTHLQELDYVSKDLIRFWVKLFYETQRLRIITSNFVRDSKQNELVKNAFIHDAKDYATVEYNIRKQLEQVCKSQEVGRWLLGITGIGPALAASLLANFDITKANYGSNFVSYAGLADNQRPWLGVEKSRAILDEILDGRTTITDEDVMEYSARVKWKYEVLYAGAYSEKTGKWSKTNLIKTAAKIPYNKELKSLMFNIACSFEYQKSRPQSVYGRILRERLTYENIMNERGKYKEQAEAIIAMGKIGKDTESYKSYVQGKLPDGHIRLRAFRYVNKIFLNHLFVEMYRVEYGKNPPRPYIIDHSDGQHNVIIPPEVPYSPIPEDNNNYADMETIKFFEPEYSEYLTDEEMAEIEEFKLRFNEKVKKRKASKNAANYEPAVQQVEEPEEKPKRKPGRPKKEKSTEDAPVETPKRRGRPPKKNNEVKTEEVEAPKKKRGRPRKNPES